MVSASIVSSLPAVPRPYGEGDARRGNATAVLVVLALPDQLRHRSPAPLSPGVRCAGIALGTPPASRALLPRLLRDPALQLCYVLGAQDLVGIEVVRRHGGHAVVQHAAPRF